MTTWRHLAAALALAVLLLLVSAPAAPAWAAPAPPLRYVVQPGDTLGAIAEEQGSTVPAILAANVLPDPNWIQAGSVLLVPAANEPVLRVEAGPGESLSAIARRYRTTTAVLRELNGMEPRERVLVGQDLLVPPHPDAPSPALPSGPVVAVNTWPETASQGETVVVQVQVEPGRAISLTAQLGDQGIPLQPLTGTGAPGTTYWGLAAIHALTTPGYASLDLRWQDAAGHNGSGIAPAEPQDDSQDTGWARWPIQVMDGNYPTYDIILPPGKGELLNPELVRAEAERLAAIWAQPESALAWQGRFLRPVAEEFVTSAPFGQRRSYNSGPVSGFHTGQDFAAPGGTPVLAPAAGTVVLAEPLVVRGNSVIIDHGAGVYSGYWHLSSIEVTAGQEVEPVDLLGLVGTTGLSTGDHLHWEMRLHGIAISPLQWVEIKFP